MPSFVHDGQRLSYSEYGEGSRVLILLPGLLFSRRMHEHVAGELAGRGNRVLTFDLLGHGDSDRPADMWRYSMTFFAEQTVALMDHLEIDQAVVGGTSLGANVTLEVAALAPERLRGMVVEMPVLDHAIVACALAFSPLLVAQTLGEPGWRLMARGLKLVPRGTGGRWGDVMLDWIRQDPAASSAVLQGLFFGRIAPHRAERRTLQAPALIIGHNWDPVHPFSDAGMLADELPNGRLVEARSFFELRFWPERLTGEIAAFLDEVWKPRRARSPRRRAAGGGTA